MNRHFSPPIFALSLTVATLLGPLCAHAAEPAEKIVRVGFVGTESQSRGVPAL